MANLKEIRTRIASVKNTQKITRAMYLVAAARLRKAQENILRLRPYADSTMGLIARLAARTEGEEEPHPLLAVRDPERVMLICMTSDRGLAGGFNAQINKQAFKEYNRLVEGGFKVDVAAIGRKGADFFKRRGVELGTRFSNVYQDLTYEKASEIGDTIITEYASGHLDGVYLVYNEFKSAISQKVTVQQVLPIIPEPVERLEGNGSDYLYEPDRTSLLATLLPLYVNVDIYRALLESVAAEHGARMSAMDSATKNAKEMIRTLTIQANRARQAAITTELTEIVSGAEALHG